MDWNELEKACESCKKCELYKTRNKNVFGVGDKKARILFVGEGPGAEEDRLGEPFVGRAGKLLDTMLASIGIDRSQIYIANIVKCRPPQNRDPSPEEQIACTPWLDAQIELIDPAMIVCLGRIAAGYLIKKDFKITAEHGHWFTYNGRRITAIYHPAALLRDPSKRGDTFEDLRMIEEESKLIK